MVETAEKLSAISLSQILAAMAVCSCSFCVGTSIGYTSPALPTMMDRNYTNFEVTKNHASWVGGIMPLAAMVGALLGGPMMVFFGRKLTVLIAAVPLISSWLLIALASSVTMLIIGRSLTGLGMGTASISLPIYVGEAFHPFIRGTFGVLMTCFSNVGLLFAYAVGSVTDWVELAYVCGAFCVPVLILMSIVPESPRWLASKGKMDKAEKSLKWLRRKDANIADELKEMNHPPADAGEQKPFCKEAFQRKYLKSIIIAVGLFAAQQGCGINAVLFYTVTIFDLSGSTIDSFVATVIVGVCNMVATIIATVVVDYTGRKLLLYISSATMTIMLAILAVFFYVKVKGADTSDYGWLPLACLIIYVVGFSLGVGPVPWLMLGEILPARIRGPCASFVVGFNWGLTFLVTKTFHDVIDGLGLYGAFGMFSVMSFLSFLFTLFLVPETNHKSLEEIEAELTGEAVK